MVVGRPVLFETFVPSNPFSLFCLQFLSVLPLQHFMNLSNASARSPLPVNRYEREQNVSPGSVVPASPPHPSPPPPLHTGIMGLGDHRRELSVLQGPQYLRNPSSSTSSNGTSSKDPTTPNVISATLSGPPNLNSSVFFDFEDNYQLSPHQRPPTSGTAPSITGPNGHGDSYFADDRRPSVASVVTNASSTGSKSSLGRSFFNRLIGNGDESPGSSDTSLHHHHGSHSSQNLARPTTPTASRPRTPLPPAEVVPFEYQDPDVSRLRFFLHSPLSFFINLTSLSGHPAIRLCPGESDTSYKLR